MGAGHLLHQRAEVEMALQGQKARSLLYRNNRDGTFADVTDKAGLGHPGFAMGGRSAITTMTPADLYVTCLAATCSTATTATAFHDVTNKRAWPTGAGRPARPRRFRRRRLPRSVRCQLR